MPPSDPVRGMSSVLRGGWGGILLPGCHWTKSAESGSARALVGETGLLGIMIPGVCLTAGGRVVPWCRPGSE